MRTRKDELAASWIEAVARSLSGRVSQAEIDRELHELYGAFTAALAAGGDDVDGEHYTEVRALLTEISRNRARQGLTPAETAVSVFALKAGFERLLEGDPRRTWPPTSC